MNSGNEDEMMNRSGEWERYQQIAARVAPGSHLLDAQLLEGGISAGMLLLKVETQAGVVRQFVMRIPGETALRQNPNAAQHEYQLLERLSSQGLPVPRPLVLDDSHHILPNTYFILDYIAAQLDFAPSDLPRSVQQMAAALVKIHSIQPHGLQLDFLPALEGRLSAEIGIRPETVNYALQEDRVRTALESAWPNLRRNPAALLHGDYWPGNILWRAGKLVGVIDWEDACLGDPLADLSIARLDLLWIHGLEAMTEFTRYYQTNIDLDFSELPFWDLYATLRFIRLAGHQLDQWAAFFHSYGRRDIQAHTLRDYFQFFVGQAFDRMEI
jgi:aminoglycoside phosphotransferase (APT) family kinase protein